MEAGDCVGTCLLLSFPEASKRLTFADRTQRLLTLASANVRGNLAGSQSTCDCAFVELEWGAPLPSAVPCAGYSLVLCAELLYEVAAVEPLLTTVRALLAPGGVAVFGHRARNGAHEACLAAAASHGLRWTEIAWRPWEGEGAAGQEAGWGCPLEILHLGKMERAED